MAGRPWKAASASVPAPARERRRSAALMARGAWDRLSSQILEALENLEARQRAMARLSPEGAAARLADLLEAFL